jgi:hypothetical protein
VLTIGLITGREVHLGLDGVEAVLLVLTLFVTRSPSAARAPMCCKASFTSRCSSCSWR